jgi:hypothetical protein
MLLQSYREENVLSKVFTPKKTVIMQKRQKLSNFFTVMTLGGGVNVPK